LIDYEALLQKREEPEINKDEEDIEELFTP
jgi:hypothetical protein